MGCRNGRSVDCHAGGKLTACTGRFGKISGQASRIAAVLFSALAATADCLGATLRGFVRFVRFLSALPPSARGVFLSSSPKNQSLSRAFRLQQTEQTEQTAS